MIEDFAVLETERDKADAASSHWAAKVDDAWLAEDLTWFGGGCRPRGHRTASAPGGPLPQSPDPSSRAVHTMLTAGGQKNGDTNLILPVPQRASPNARPRFPP
jgi:hypothetical protein